MLFDGVFRAGTEAYTRAGVPGGPSPPVPSPPGGGGALPNDYIIIEPPGVAWQAVILSRFELKENVLR